MTNEIRTEAVAATEAPSAELRDDPGAQTLPLSPALAAAREGEPAVLLSPQRRAQLREAWLQIQSSFVDGPGEAVRNADGLVQEVLNAVTEAWEAARRDLEREWDPGDAASTETLRLALRSYRVLFNRLLAS